MRHIATLFLLAASLLTAHAQQPQPPQQYPNQVIKLIVSVPAGGLQDALARSLARHMGQELGQQVIVDNKPGANTMIAASTAAKAAPDGYTLLIATDSTMSINPHLYSKLAYDPQRDFAPISALVQLTEALFVNADLPVHTLADYVAYVKAHPGGTNYASFGIGSTAHLAAAEFARRIGAQQTHVPYKGGADAMPALASNQVQSLITATAVAMPLVKAGKVRMIAVAGPKRLAAFPDTPTFAESGYPDFKSSAWFGLVAPAGTPKPIVERLSRIAAQFVDSPEFKNQFMTPYSIEPVGSTPQEFDAFMNADRARYAAIVRAANARLD